MACAVQACLEAQALRKGSVPRIIAFYTGCPQCPPKILRNSRVQFPRDPRHRHCCAPPQFSGQKHLVGMPFPELAEFFQSHAPLFQKLPHDSSRLFLHRLFQRLARSWRRTGCPRLLRPRARVGVVRPPEEWSCPRQCVQDRQSEILDQVSGAQPLGMGSWRLEDRVRSSRGLGRSASFVLLHVSR